MRNLIACPLESSPSVAATFFYPHHTSGGSSHRGGHHFGDAPSSGHAKHDGVKHKHDEINTEIETTELGVKVIQTSSNPKVVRLLQKHADEVGVMANRGMEAVHKRMAGHS